MKQRNKAIITGFESEHRKKTLSQNEIERKRNKHRLPQEVGTGQLPSKEQSCTVQGHAGMEHTPKKHKKRTVKLNLTYRKNALFAN